MTTVVADSSALVSLGVVADCSPEPLSILRASYEVVVPQEVVEELREIASYDDTHGRAATVVLDRQDAITTETIALDSTFPLDDGENAAVTLANEFDASVFLCDEFNQLGLIHASLVNRLGVKPRGFFPWISRTRLGYHRSGRLERYQRPRSGRPQAPMPAVATPTSALAGVC